MRLEAGSITTSSRTQIIAYWIFTVIAALQSAAGAALDLSGDPDFAEIAMHLGYPPYLLIILGFWRALACIALLVPGFPIVKEWAYAGLFFDHTGAMASHIIVGDDIGQWIWPATFALITMASWALRPGDRRLRGTRERFA